MSKAKYRCHIQFTSLAASWKPIIQGTIYANNVTYKMCKAVVCTACLLHEMQLRKVHSAY